MGIPPDEHLPEVVPGNAPQMVPDGSPQALTAREAYAHREYLEGSGKYPGESTDSPKFAEIPAGLESAYYDSSSRGDAHSSVPWEPVSPITGTGQLQAGAVSGSHVGSSEFEKPQEEKIFGLKKRAFYILAALILLVAVAVGVGVGLGLALRQSPNADKQTSNSGSTPTGPNSGSSPADSTSSNQPPLPQPTGKNQDPPLNETTIIGPFKFQGWEFANFTGRQTDKIRGMGITQFDFSIRSYVWDPNAATCCVTFCNGTTGNGSYRCGGWSRPEASGSFNRIVTYCGGLDITNSAVACS